MQQHKCAELNIKTHFKDMKRIEMHCSKVLVLSILRKPIVLQPNQLCLLSSCHHNKGFDADFLQKHRRRRALKSSSNGHLLHVIDSVITCHCTACKLLHLFESHWTSTIFCIGTQIPDLSVNRSYLSKRFKKMTFFCQFLFLLSFLPRLFFDWFRCWRRSEGTMAKDIKGQGPHSPLPQMARYVHESHKLVIGRWTSSQVNRSAHEIGAWLHSKSKKWVSVIVGKQVVSWMKRIEWMKKLWWDKGTTHLIDMH
jgi:hypothetical protein